MDISHRVCTHRIACLPGAWLLVDWGTSAYAQDGGNTSKASILFTMEWVIHTIVDFFVAIAVVIVLVDVVRAVVVRVVVALFKFVFICVAYAFRSTEKKQVDRTRPKTNSNISAHQPAAPRQREKKGPDPSGHHDQNDLEMEPTEPGADDHDEEIDDRDDTTPQFSVSSSDHATTASPTHDASINIIHDRSNENTDDNEGTTKSDSKSKTPRKDLGLSY